MKTKWESIGKGCNVDGNSNLASILWIYPLCHFCPSAFKKAHFRPLGQSLLIRVEELTPFWVYFLRASHLLLSLGASSSSFRNLIMRRGKIKDKPYANRENLIRGIRQVRKPKKELSKLGHNFQMANIYIKASLKNNINLVIIIIIIIITHCGWQIYCQLWNKASDQTNKKINT